MTDIPKEVLKAGRRVYDQLGRGSVADSEIIARALLTRDKRAAEIALSEAHADCDVAEQIAKLILTYPDTPTGQEDGNG